MSYRYLERLETTRNSLISALLRARHCACTWSSWNEQEQQHARRIMQALATRSARVGYPFDAELESLDSGEDTHISSFQDFLLAVAEVYIAVEDHCSAVGCM